LKKTNSTPPIFPQQSNFPRFSPDFLGNNRQKSASNLVGYTKQKPRKNAGKCVNTGPLLLELVAGFEPAAC